MRKFEPPYVLIRDQLKHGGVIPFLGSGASLGKGRRTAVWDKGLPYLPDAHQLARHLARRSGFPRGERTDLATVAQYYAISAGRKALHEELHDIFARDYGLTTLHQLLAEVTAPLLIVTTNYDDLIERAFETKLRAYDLVIHTTDPAMENQLLWWQHGKNEPAMVTAEELPIDLGEVTVIYKMHGAVDRRDPTRDQYVITEDDYVDFLSRMTDGTAIPRAFADPFRSRHFLFLGHGLHDWNIRVVLNRIDKALQRPKDKKSWAIRYRPSRLEERFWQERGVEVYDTLIEEFVDRCPTSGLEPGKNSA